MPGGETECYGAGHAGINVRKAAGRSRRFSRRCSLDETARLSLQLNTLTNSLRSLSGATRSCFSAMLLMR